MMGLGKLQRFANFEGAGFICYGNIRKFDFKNWGKPLWFGETDFTIGFADPMFSVRCATDVELRLQQMGDIHEKPHFTMENFKFRGGGWIGGWKFLHQTTKMHTLTPNMVEQIVWRMWQWRCFDTIRRREKQEAPLTLRGQRGRCRNIKEEPQILWSFPSPRPRPHFLWVWFYGGSWQTQVVY